MGNAGRNGGEYYTPRPLIRAMVRVGNPGSASGYTTGRWDRRDSCAHRSIA